MNPTQDRSPERIATLVQVYLDADYRWTMEGDWHDLRVGLQAPGLELLFPEAQTFGLLSAWDPWSEKRPEAENRAADDILHDTLKQSGLPYVAAFASAPNRSWREPSWVVIGMPSQQFDALSRRHEQLATLWWTPGRPVHVRVDATCPDRLRNKPHIDWLR